jgi:hypothetical protein
MLKLLALFIVFVTALSSCSKDEKEYRLDRAGLKYIQLRLNQYFIYKDSASGRLDSVVVTESFLSTEQFTYTNPFSSTPITARREVFDLTMVRKGPAGDSTWLKGQAKGELFVSRLVLEDRQNNWLFFFGALYSTGQIYKLPSLTVEGTTYSDVIVLINSTTCHYWAPSVGLIKLTTGYYGPPNQIRNTYTLLRHS